MIRSLYLRALWESAQKKLGTLEQQRRAAQFSADSIDIDSMPILVQKASVRARNPSGVGMICVHITAVRGGFGVQASGPTGWRHWMDRGTLSPELAAKLVSISDHADDVDMAKRVALWSRFRNTPYHQIACQNGDILRNRRLSQRSYHGNGANDGAGFAMDVGPGEELDGFLIETGQKALEDLFWRMNAHREGTAPPIRVVAHRCASNSRLGDPGAIVWQEVVLPVVGRVKNLTVDYEYRSGNGLPIPNTWDPAALFDARGRRL